MFERRITIFSIFLFVTIGTVIFCVRESEKLSEFQQVKNFLSKQNSDYIKLAKEISKNHGKLSKSSEKIFGEKSNSKEVIEKFIRKFSSDKILLKHNQKFNVFGEIEELEFKFTSPNEKNIYEFLQNIYFEINGLLLFDNVTIAKNPDGKYAAEISCKVIRYAKKFEKYLRIKNQQSKIQIKNWLHVFQITREKYTLDGILQDSVAFVNRANKKVGDEIGEYELTKIDKSSITIKRRNFKKVIFLGESW